MLDHRILTFAQNNSPKHSYKISTAKKAETPKELRVENTTTVENLKLKYVVP